MKPGGISSTWWETSTVAGESGSFASTLSVDTRSSRPPRSRPGGGLVEEQQLGVGHQGAGDLHPLALALAERAERPVREVLHPHLGQQLGRPVVVEVVVGLAPAPDHAVRRGDDDVVHPLVARDPLGQGSAGESDPRPQVEHVDRAEHLVEDAGHARRGMDLGRGHLEQRGLAGAVRAEDHPALVLLDRPVDRVEESRLPAPDAHVGELEDGGHDANPRAHERTVPTAYPRPP